MKMIVAYIRHEAFEPIRTELLELGFPSLTISEVKGSGRQKGITERYRGAELTNYLRPKVKIECVVADSDVQTIVDTILKHGRTGAVGDGKVFVLPVEEAYRVRTGESGEEVLQAHPDAAAAGAQQERSGARGGGIETRARRPAPGAGCGRGARRAAARRAPADGRGRARRRRPRAGRGARRRAVGAPVAIVVPRLARGRARRARRRRAAARRAAALRRRARQRPPGRRCRRACSPRSPITSGDGPRRRGRAAAPATASRAPRPAEFLYLAAVAALTEVAVEEAREEVEQNLRGSFLEDVRARPDLGARRDRAPRRRGSAATWRAASSCSAPSSPPTARATSSRRSPATSRARSPSTSTPDRWRAGRVYALLPATGADDAPERDARARARGWRSGCGRHGTVGLSSFYADPGELARAIQEAELVLDVLRRSEGGGEATRDIGTGHLPAALPRARLAPRGGALLLRGHRRPDRPLRRPVPHGPRRDARGLPRAELQHERDRRRRSTPTATPSPTGSSA